MSRVEEIKATLGRLDYSEATYIDEDICYLLSRLEVLEKVVGAARKRVSYGHDESCSAINGLGTLCNCHHEDLERALDVLDAGDKK